MQLITIIGAVMVLLFSGMFYTITKQTESDNQQAVEMAKLGFQQCAGPNNKILWKKECNASAE